MRIVRNAGQRAGAPASGADSGRWDELRAIGYIRRDMPNIRPPFTPPAVGTSGPDGAGQTARTDGRHPASLELAVLGNCTRGHGLEELGRRARGLAAEL